MTDINQVVLIGHLTRDLGTDERSFGYVSNGMARANVSIAVNRSRKNGDQWVDEVNYFDVTIWGKTAENLKPYLTKGKQICVEGYLKQDRWEKDGQKFSKVTVVANNVQLLGGRGESNSSGGYAQQNGGVPRFQPVNSAPSMSTGYSAGYSAPEDSYGDIGSGIDEDVPF
jgi:single-strand DNA-binding protein